MGSAGLAAFPRAGFTVVLTGMALLGLSGCFCRPRQEAAEPSRPVAPPLPATSGAEPSGSPVAGSAPPRIIADLLVVSLDNAPLQGMIPIVTERPNAFDPPPFRGEPTDARGRSRFVFPADRKWCLRAWDPELKWFANNFLEVAPSEEDAGMDGTIVMAPASAIACMITDTAGTPLANRPVEVMLSHPRHGPWWPARQTSSPEGTVLFPQLPPGRFDLEFRTDDRITRLPDMLLPPGGALNLGTVGF